MNILISKIILSVLYFYLCIYQYLFDPVPNLSLFLSLTLFMFMAAYLIKNRRSLNLREGFTTEMSMLLLFMSSVFIGGLFSARDYTLFFSETLRYVQNYFIILSLLFICRYDNNTNFLKNILIAIGIIYSAKLIFAGHPISQGRLTFSPSSNPNTISTVMHLSVFCLITYCIEAKLIKKVLISFLIISVSYALFLTGSRTSLAALAVLIFFFVLFCCIPAAFKRNPVGTTIGLLSASFISISVALYFWPQLSETSTFKRLFNLSLELAGGRRMGMFIESLSIFLDNPVFGVGFQNFRYVSSYGTYSHSTYTEVLACTGIVGSVFYFGAYIIMFANTIKAYLFTRQNGSEADTAKAKMTIVLIISMFIMGFGIVLEYHFMFVFFSVLIIAQNNIITKRRNITLI